MKRWSLILRVVQWDIAIQERGDPNTQWTVEWQETVLGVVRCPQISQHGGAEIV